MENQINSGDQNNQQSGNNPISQEVQIPEKPKINYRVVSAIISIILILSGSLYYILILRNQKVENITLNTRQNNISTPTNIPSGAENINWSGKTYTSSMLKFSLQYPDGWFISDDILSSYDLSKVVNKETFPKPPYAKCDFAGYAQVKDTLGNIEQVSVIKSDSPRITEFKTEEKILGPGGAKYFLIDDRIHNPVVLSCFSFDENLREIVEQILSTIKFLGGTIGIPVIQSEVVPDNPIFRSTSGVDKIIMRVERLIGVNLINYATTRSDRRTFYR